MPHRVHFRPDEHPDARTLRRLIGAGAAAGIRAGVLFVVMQVLTADAVRQSPILPLRMFASIVLGVAALRAPAATTVLIGITVHFILAALYGAAFGAMNFLAPARTRASYGREIALGIVTGGVLWLVNLQGVAPALLPWFLTLPQLPQLLLHLVFFGAPLGIAFAARERRWLVVPGHEQPT